MKEKPIKITDNDIIKDLNLCANIDISFCKECTHRNFIYSDESRCCIHLMKNALDLINRQKAEIEEMHQDVKTAEEYAWQMKTARAEAIKDFADRLKKSAMQKFDWNEYIEVEDIDNLVKEMVGEGK